jgi:protein-S-isoprenylcysteine O-methyltransferase Ste14
MAWAADLFHRAGACFQLNRESSVLVTSGPFRFSRNPMYLGMLIWLLGMPVLLGTLSTSLFPVLFFWWPTSLLLFRSKRGAWSNSLGSVILITSSCSAVALKSRKDLGL